MAKCETKLKGKSEVIFGEVVGMVTSFGGREGKERGGTVTE